MKKKIQFQRGYEVQRHVPRDGRRDRMGYNMYTSEPDLRFNDSRQPPPMGFQYQNHPGDNGIVKGGRMSRSKKKYRAPQVPPNSMHHNGVSAIMNFKYKFISINIAKPLALIEHHTFIQYSNCLTCIDGKFFARLLSTLGEP